MQSSVYNKPAFPQHMILYNVPLLTDVMQWKYTMAVRNDGILTRTSTILQC